MKDRLLLQTPEQLVRGLPTEPEHHSQALLRDMFDA